MITASQGSSLKDATIEFPQGIVPTVLDESNVTFRLDAKVAAATKLMVLRVKSGASAPSTVLLPLPALPKADASPDAAAKKLAFAKTAPTIAQGKTGPYTIKGSNFQLIASFRYLGTPLAVHYSTDYTSATFDTLPVGLTASPGQVSLEVRLLDGTVQVFGIPVVAPASS